MTLTAPPNHYKPELGLIDPFDAYQLLRGNADALAFMGGTAIKYLVRYDRKGTPIEDLKKAIVCIERMIEVIEEGDEPTNPQLVKH
jgi:hypothetical protein